MTDRELDALVAEKVMGRTVVGRATIVSVEGCDTVMTDVGPEGWSCAAETGPVMVGDPCWCKDVEPPDDQDDRAKYDAQMSRFGHLSYCLEAVPWYSTDIAAAWQVVEKLRPRTFRLEFDTDYGINKRTGWTVCINAHCLVQFAATAPRAICLAALKAVGHTVEDQPRP